MSEAILPIADTHIGSKLGLLHPKTKGYKQNSWQKYTWKCWQHMLSLLPEQLDAVVFMDEMMDGPEGKNHKYGTLITEPKAQREAARLVLEPLAARARERWCIIGSYWHVGEWGRETENLANALEAHVWEDTDENRQAGHNLFLKKGSVVLDFAHPRSVVMVNKSMPLEREMRYRLVDDPLPKQLHGRAKVRCIVRAHAHDFGVWTDRHGVSIGLPCWQGMYYGYGVGKRAIARIWKDIGWVLLDVDDKRRHPVEYDYELYDYPKAAVWDMEEEKWVRQSRSLRSP